MKIKRKNILPVNEPLVKVYPHYGHIMSIFNEYELPILLNDMLTIIYDSEKERADFDIGFEIVPYIANYPLCFNYAIPRNLISSNWKSLSNFLIDSINDGCYITFLANTYYISAYTETYRRLNFLHDIMIYGYDEKNKIFYGTDAFEKGKYERREIPFEEIERSFSCGNEEDWFEGIRLIKRKENQFMGIWYEIEYIKEQCNQFLKGEYIKSPIYLERKRDIKDKKYSYGINVYDAIHNYIKYLKDDYDTKSADIRLFYLLFDHANVLKYFSKELSNKGILINSNEIYNGFDAICNSLTNLYSKVIKYNLTSSESLKNIILENILSIKQKLIETVTMFKDSIPEKPITNNIKLFGEILPRDIAIEYNGNWKSISGDNIIKYTKDNKAELRYQFLGDSLKIYSSSKKTGTIRIVIDSKETAIINMKDYILNDDICMYNIEDLKYGYHTIELINDVDEDNYLSIVKLVVEETKEDITSKVIKLEEDKKTQGTWKGRYGNDGYEIIGDSLKLPTYISENNYVYKDAAYVLLLCTTGNHKALNRVYKEDERIVAYYLKESEFTLEMVVSGKHQVSFYFVDYDNLNRSFELIIEDGIKKTELLKEYVENFNNGIYLKYEIEGYVKIRFKCVSGPDVALSGVFFD